MPTGEYYLQQACSCFDMATMSREVSVRQRWIDRANEYLILADALGDDPLPELPLTGGNEQVQPMQQQQQQATPKSEDEA